LRNNPSTKGTPGRKPKPRRKLVNFGEFAKSARERCASSQQKAVTVLAEAGLNIAQSWVAMLETGRISDPDAPTLAKIARAFRVDYDALVYALVRDKYALDDLSQVTPLSRERWRAAAGLLQSFPAVGRVEGLEIDQLRAKTRMLASEILDVEGLARWQREFPKLKDLWIVTSRLMDDRITPVREAVVHNLRRGVRYSYFVPKLDLEDARPFWLFLHRLAQDYPNLRNRLQKQVQRVGLEEAELRWILTDLIIANPTDPATRTAFVGIRKEGAVKFACRMSDFDAESAVHGILPFLARRARQDMLKLK
jgi:transcriptional regulator with XRE-family HTH domain